MYATTKGMINCISKRRFLESKMSSGDLHSVWCGGYIQIRIHWSRFSVTMLIHILFCYEYDYPGDFMHSQYLKFRAHDFANY